jgi:glutathione S-transferase
LETARYASISVICEETSPSDLKAITPFAKSLVLSFRDQHMTNSSAMMRTVASLAPAAGLLGNSDLQDAIVDSWLSFIWTSLDVPLHAVGQNEVQPMTMIQKALDRAFETLNTQLKDRVYMVGDGITLGDISLAVTLKNANGKDSILKEHSNLSRWYHMVLDQGILQS